MKKTSEAPLGGPLAFLSRSLREAQLSGGNDNRMHERLRNDLEKLSTNLDSLLAPQPVSAQPPLSTGPRKGGLQLGFPLTTKDRPGQTKPFQSQGRLSIADSINKQNEMFDALTRLGETAVTSAMRKSKSEGDFSVLEKMRDGLAKTKPPPASSPLGAGPLVVSKPEAGAIEMGTTQSLMPPPQPVWKPLAGSRSFTNLPDLMKPDFVEGVMRSLQLPPKPGQMLKVTSTPDLTAAAKPPTPSALAAPLVSWKAVPEFIDGVWKSFEKNVSSELQGGAQGTANAGRVLSLADVANEVGRKIKAGIEYLDNNLQQQQQAAAAAAASSAANGEAPVGLLSNQQRVRAARRKHREMMQQEAAEALAALPFATGLIARLSRLVFLLTGGQKPLSPADKNIAIVTTASLPWMTGTAVNPLLRAAYLARRSPHVTLMVPWIPREDQVAVYPNERTFDNPQEQEAYVRAWLKQRLGFEAKFKLQFYPGRYDKARGSIFPVGDITEFIPDSSADVAILEEPEHLTWYHHGRRWTDKFEHVVGVVHTNYLEYARRVDNGELLAAFLAGANKLCTRVHCDKVLRLSGATEDLPRSQIVNVHGVSPKFLEIGAAKAAEYASRLSAAMMPPPLSPSTSGASASSGTTAGVSVASGSTDRVPSSTAIMSMSRQASSSSTPLLASTPSPCMTPSASVTDLAAMDKPAPMDGVTGASADAGGKGGEGDGGSMYYIGKALWGKGYRELVDLMTGFAQETGSAAHMDIYGSGPDAEAIQSEVKSKGLDFVFHGAKDHADKDLHKYKVFVNPSSSDVLCTTTAEALAMGKFVVVADHPSNEFFKSFSNCLTFRTPAEFQECLKKAAAAEPKPLSPEESYALSWEAATDRFLNAAGIGQPVMPSPLELKVQDAVDNSLAAAWWMITGNEAVRMLGGAPPASTYFHADDVTQLGLLPEKHPAALPHHYYEPLPAC
eukprot:jgi/Mesvir1/25033/Mv16972-RA.1